MKIAVGSLLIVVIVAPHAQAQPDDEPFPPPMLSLAPVTTEPSTQVAVDSVQHLNFLQHFSEYQPVYFLVGNETPSTKFQISFKYQVLNRDGDWARDYPILKGFYLAYTQTSFWDPFKESSPFFDTTYNPEAFLLYNKLLSQGPADDVPWRVGLQTGVEHESNGRGGTASRSLNTLYAEPHLVIGDEHSLFLLIAPRGEAYIGSLVDNPDIANYRGYGSLRVVVGWYDSMQLAAIGRLGDDWDKGSLQLDLSCPVHALFKSDRHNLDINLHLQFFTGYGESLVRYNDADSTIRFGISIVR